MSRRGIRVAVAAVATVAAVALAGCTSGTGGGANTAASSTADAQAAGVQSAFESVVTAVLPSIVEVKSGRGLGSGIVYDAKGDIVTNAHVVGSGQQFQVSLATGGAELPATIVASYPPDDLAVVRLTSPPSGLKPASFADSNKVKVGQLAMAMGNPLGLNGSVTDGIVSAKNRTVTEPQSADSPGATIANAIQTSAAINPGNSGGALVDLDSHVIGIPTLAAIDPQLGSVAPGIGFAIPSNTATDIANQIIKDGKVTSSNRAALDISARTVVGTNGQGAGALVVTVTPGGAADKAGIQAGELITAINDTQIRTTDDLSAALAQLKPGDQAKVSVTKPDGSKETVTVTLGELK